MKLHADLTVRASVHAAGLAWLPSPAGGVDRRMLHRVGDEVAQATSIVRYAPGSRFAPHTHGGGEEFLVLEGVFQDESGDYPAGTYVRNPLGSRHAPGSQAGTTIFVKLWQFGPGDTAQVRIPAHAAARVTEKGRPGVQVAPLHRTTHEDVRIEHWTPGHTIELDLPRGGEFLVLEGSFTEGGETFASQSWLRLPAGSRLVAQTGEAGTRVWAKLGHLNQFEHLATLVPATQA
jgi:anti-sigma factor ChrR (cupin superfamily)